MSAPRVLVNEQPKGGQPLVAAPDLAWRLLGLAGFAFALVGGIDVALTWYPLDFGSPEWEFGTITASLDGLPLPVMGLFLVLASAIARGVRWPARTAAVLLVILSVLILLGGIFYLTNVPIAMRAVAQNPTASLGITRSLIKTSIQVVVYPTIFLVVAAKGWTHLRAR